MRFLLKTLPTVFHKMGGEVFNKDLVEVYNINLFYGTAFRCIGHWDSTSVFPSLHGP